MRRDVVRILDDGDRPVRSGCGSWSSDDGPGKVWRRPGVACHGRGGGPAATALAVLLEWPFGGPLGRPWRPLDGDPSETRERAMVDLVGSMDLVPCFHTRLSSVTPRLLESVRIPYMSGATCNTLYTYKKVYWCSQLLPTRSRPCLTRDIFEEASGRCSRFQLDLISECSE